MIISILSSSRTGKIICFLAAVLTLIFFVSYGLAQSLDTEKRALEEEMKMRRNDSNPFGVLEFLHWNHDWNNYKYPTRADIEKSVKLMKEAGVGIVRVDFGWGDIEPEEGKFDFKKYDTIVDVVTKNGIQILGILDYTVWWASCNGAWNTPPKDNKLFVNYAVKVVSRYKDKVKYWELWNEPDSSTYWSEQDGLKGYCVLLKEVYTALKKADPGCKVLNGGFAQGNISVNRLYDNGAKDYFDILNIHIFENPLNRNTIKGVAASAKLAYKIMKRNGDGHKKIWITEIGCPGVKKGLKVDNWWMGRNPDEQQQALWVKEVYATLLKQEAVEKVFWAFFRDCNKHWSNGTDYFGLIRWDFSKKPAFKAYQKCSDDWKKSKISP